MVSYLQRGNQKLNRMNRVGILALALAASFPAWVHAGAMLWQVTGMEGIESRYGFANGGRMGRFSDSATSAESVWSMEGSFTATATAVMRWEIWYVLKAMMDDKSEETPSYRDLIDSGVISVNSIQMPELLGNNER